ncbi:polymeric immunoglobulin receptor-like [Centropristis striata]|uniref:polymeric immunoglobulin receptor-like n=1 Tax=Centropristis striata TaxID=184440 RepID=UPI0027E0D12D|nr:polymeric immunoglobulin receptor-like [Centropristis striata]
MKFRMNVLFFCFFSALCGGNTQLVSPKVYIFTGAEGATGSLNCSPYLTGNTKFFCKNTCAAEDILIKTEDVSAQNGRYSIAYKTESSVKGTLTVTIRDLTRSDAGRYRCGLGQTLAPDSYSDFEVRVSEEPFLDRNGLIMTAIGGEDITYYCSGAVYGRYKFFCKDKCQKEEDVLVETDENKAWRGRYVIEYTEGLGLMVTIREATTSDTGGYKCGYGRALSPDSYVTFPIIVIDDVSSTPQDFLPLAVCLPLVLVMVAVFLPLLYRWKTRSSCGFNTRGTADDVRMEAPVTYENCPSDALYLSLDPASRDQDQVYSHLKTANRR